MAFDCEDVYRAYRRIKGYIPPTPLTSSFYLGNNNRNYFFKLESLQHTKSFKIRGALNKMLTLSDDQKRKGVSTISSGNHGSAVSYAASLLGISEAIIIVPATTPQSKIDKIRYFGGEALLMGKNYDEAHLLGMDYISGQGLTYIDSYDCDPLVYSGQGTIALEILRQNPTIDTIVAPIGGGGLVTGIAVAAKAAKPSVRIVGVQTQACPALIASYRDGVLYDRYENEPSLCDALVGGIGHLCYEMAHDYVDLLLEVSEESIAKAVSFMAKKEKYVAEPASCTTIAAVRDCGDEIGGQNIALIISGSNIDEDLFTQLISTY